MNGLVLNLMIVSIDLRLYLCGNTKSSFANHLLTSEQPTYSTISKSWLSRRQHFKKSTFNNWLFSHINFLESFAGQNSINAQIQLLFFLASTIKRLILLGSLFLPAPQKQMAKAHTQLYLGYTKPI